MVYGVLGIVEDITDRKAAEDELGKLRKAVEQSANIVVITDVEGISEHVNRAFERSSGYTQEEILGRNTRILKSGMHPAEFYRDLWATIKSGRSWHGQFWRSRTTASPVSWPGK
jgi:PAS domain S-box-containing protein